jgi:hypothetical protein
MFEHFVIVYFFQSLMKYLQDESLDKRKTAFDTSGWQTENVQVCHVKTFVYSFQCSVLFSNSQEDKDKEAVELRSSDLAS